MVKEFESCVGKCCEYDHLFIDLVRLESRNNIYFHTFTNGCYIIDRQTACC